jgi:hypothetical protein
MKKVHDYHLLQAERDALRAENARLREALEECRDNIIAEYSSERVWDVNFPKACEALRAADAGKGEG